MNAAFTVQWAWLAGLLDGEGSFQYRKCNPRNGRKTCYQPAVSLEMTSEKAVTRAAEILSVPIRSYQGRGQGRKPTWVLVLTGKHLRGSLPHLLPLLVAKREQASILQRVVEECPSRSGQQLSAEDLAVREALYLTFQKERLT